MAFNISHKVLTVSFSFSFSAAHMELGQKKFAVHLEPSQTVSVEALSSNYPIQLQILRVKLIG